MDDDDLPARLLPRRSAPGEHPRARREAGTIGLVDFGAVGKLTDDDMSKLTRPLHRRRERRTSTLLPKRLADLGVRYPKEREEEFLAELREMYYRYYGASLSEIDPIQVDPRGVPAHLLDEPAPADALPAARPRDRDARLGRHGALSGLQRLRGGAAVRARPAARAVHAAAGRAARARETRSAYAQVFAEAPYQFHDFMEEIRDGQIEVGFVHKGLDDFMEQHAARLQPARGRAHRRRRADRLEPDRDLRDRPGRTCSASTSSRSIGFALSTVLGIWLLWGVVRSGRL